MRALTATDVLALWDSGAARHPLDRSALLCAWARPDLPPDAVADLPLGCVTRELLHLHAASFGAHIQGHLDCPGCGQRLALELDVADVLQPQRASPAEIELGGLRVRAPCLRDLAAIASQTDVGTAARQLLERCTLRGLTRALDDAALREIEGALDAADPDADIALALRCDQCGEQHVAALDAASLLWEQIEARGRLLLAEVHLLASAYGWSEGQILALSAARRATYLSLVGT
jgi:hypothetical protein